MSSHAEDGMLLAYKRLRTAYDVSLAANQRLEDENQRLREALERIEQVACEFGYTGDERDSCACPACETLVIAREALAGDAE